MSENKHTVALTSSEIESDFIVATNNAIANAENEFEFQGYVVTVEAALKALKSVLKHHTIH